MLLLNGCGYGKISPKAYEHAKALYSICNRKDKQRLTRYATLLREARTQGEISPKEADWLDDIVQEAQAGEWEDAAAKARRMMTDQVEE